MSDYISSCQNEKNKISNFEDIETERDQSEGNKEEYIPSYQKYLDAEKIKVAVFEQFSFPNSESTDDNTLENQSQNNLNGKKELYTNNSIFNLKSNIQNNSNSNEKTNFNIFQVNSNDKKRPRSEKKKKTDKKKHDGRLEALKGAGFQFGVFLQKYGNIRLPKINYNNGFFGTVKKNKDILEMKMKEIFKNDNLDTKYIEPQDEDKKKKFNFFWESIFKSLFENYFLIKRTFNIGGEEMYIEDFPTLYDELERRIKKYYKKYDDVIEKAEKIKRFIFCSFEVFNNFQGIVPRKEGEKDKKNKKKKKKWDKTNLNSQNNVIDDFISDVCGNIEKETTEEDAKKFLEDIEAKIGAMKIKEEIKLEENEI